MARRKPRTARAPLTALNLLAAERAAHDSLYHVHIDIVDDLLKNNPRLREVAGRASVELFRAMADELERSLNAENGKTK